MDFSKAVSVLDISAWKIVEKNSYELLVKESYINFFSSEECTLCIDSSHDNAVFQISGGLENLKYGQGKYHVVVKPGESNCIKIINEDSENLRLKFDILNQCENDFSGLLTLGYKTEERDFLYQNANLDRRKYVVFTSFGVDNRPLKNFEFTGHFKDFGGDVLFLRDNSRQWYLGHINQFSKDANDTKQKLKDFIGDTKEVTFLGVSMGGFAALYYGCLLDVDRVLVISPQIDITNNFRISNRDNRWERHLNLVNARFQGSSLNLFELTERAALTTKVEVFVSKNDELDRQHVRIIENLQNVAVNYIDSDDHYLAGKMASNGELFKLIFRVKSKNEK